jgi:hypothetical protein
MVARQTSHRTAGPKQNHPRRNKSKAGKAATLRSPPASALNHAVRVVHSVCCLAGSASLIDDLRAELRVEGVPSARSCKATGISMAAGTTKSAAPARPI